MKKTIIASAISLTMLLFASTSVASFSYEKRETVAAIDLSDPEHIDEYYENVNGSGSNLLNSICSAISSPFNSIGYSSLKNNYAITDERDDGYLFDIYSDNTNYTLNDAGSSASTIGQGWNKEHTIPQSWWGGGTSGQGCDIIIVRLSDIHCNSVRGNLIYGEVTTSKKNDIDDNKVGNCSNYAEIGVTSSTEVFEPRDAIKGDMARTYFYAMARYLKSGSVNGPATKWTSGNGSSVFSASGNNGFDSKYVNMLIRWHKEDPVDQREIARNYGVEFCQKNRNPFVDHPSWVDLIWGGTYVGLNEENTSSGNVINGQLGPAVGITSISKTSVSLSIGDTTTISAVTSNQNSISWSSSNTAVATVSASSADSGENITISAVGEGTANIIASATIEGKTYQKTCEVTVIDPDKPVPAVISVTVSPTSLSLDLNGTKTGALQASVVALDGAPNTVTWSSTNENVATVKDGTVTAVGTGNAIIKATSTFDSTKYGSCTVTVIDTTPGGGEEENPPVTPPDGGEEENPPVTPTGPTLTSIEVTPPTKTSYKVGEQLDLTGFKVIAHYSDNSTKEVTASVTINVDTSKEGAVSIFVSYEENGVSFGQFINFTVSSDSDDFGCGGSIIATSALLSITSLLGAGLILIKKHRKFEDR